MRFLLLTQFTQAHWRSETPAEQTWVELLAIFSVFISTKDVQRQIRILNHEDALQGAL